MRILLTGAAGQLGRCLLDRFPADWQVYPFSAQELDITQHQALRTCIAQCTPDVIINAAAYTAVDQAESNPQHAFAVNADGPALLANVAQEFKARVIHISTDYVFDGTKTKPWQEGDPPSPINVYGLSKFEGEKRLIQELPGAVIVRTAWVFSEYGRNFVRTMLNIGRQRPQINVVDDQIGNPTYAGDLANLLIMLAQQPQIKGVLHFAGNETVSWFAFAQAIFQTAATQDAAYASVSVSPVSSDAWPTAARRPRNAMLRSQRLPALGYTSSNWRARLVTVIKALLAEETQKRVN